jgi:hypothetical protein
MSSKNVWEVTSMGGRIWDPNYIRGGFFGPWFFIILKNSHQDLSNEGPLYFEFTRSHWVAQTYRISSYSFRGNYSFLNLEIQRSQYIKVRKLFKGGNYMRKYGSYFFYKLPSFAKIEGVCIVVCPYLFGWALLSWGVNK